MRTFDPSLLVTKDVLITLSSAILTRYKKALNDFSLKIGDKVSVSTEILSDNSQYKVDIKCKSCGDIREVTFAYRTNHCKKCSNKKNAANRDFTGVNNPNFKPYISDKQREQRVEDKRDARFRRWSLAVKKKAGFICQVCLTDNARFNSHHLLGWANNPEHRYSIDNGVCLCVGCHKNLHKMFGLNTSVEDYIKFKEGYRNG